MSGRDKPDPKWILDNFIVILVMYYVRVAAYRVPTKSWTAIKINTEKFLGMHYSNHASPTNKLSIEPEKSLNGYV